MKHPLKSLVPVFVAVLLVTALSASSRGVDARIRARVGHFIADHATYSHVQFQVEDAIVRLKGTVELESQRQALVREVKALPEVAGVRSTVLLDPPAPPDDVLYPRVLESLKSLHIPSLRVSVHEGLVTVAGSVRHEHDREAVVATAQGTAGVKEVVSQLRVEEGQ